MQLYGRGAGPRLTFELEASTPGQDGGPQHLSCTEVGQETGSASALAGGVVGLARLSGGQDVT